MEAHAREYQLEKKTPRCISLSCKLIPEKHWEYEYGLLVRTSFRKGQETILNTSRIVLLLFTMKEQRLVLFLVLLTTGILVIIGLYTKQMKMNLDAGKGFV